MYTSQGAIPKTGHRKRNEISSRFGKNSAAEGVTKAEEESHFHKKATDIIDSWTWGNQPGVYSTISNQNFAII